MEPQPRHPTRFTRLLQVAHRSFPGRCVRRRRRACAAVRARRPRLIGGGYGDAQWLEEQFAAAQGERVGVGFITWSLARNPALLAQVLEHRPAAVMLSFGDPRPFAPRIRAAGARVICQCQELAHVAQAVEAGADVVVAQGTEAGGHGAARGTLSFAPEAADHLARHAPDTVLLAAGGIADGRGLAAALMLGADGVLVGTRFWASREALVKEGHHRAILQADGDATLRTRVPDVVRELPWPAPFTARIRRNAFTGRWHGREEELARAVATEGPRYAQAWEAGDAEHTAVWFGEAAGLIGSIEPAAAILRDIVAQAARRLMLFQITD